MKLSPRFGVDSLFVIGGAFLAVVAMAFSVVVAGWIGFGVFTGLALLAFASAAAMRRIGLKAVYGLFGVVALWSLIAALVFSGAALMWLVFAGGVALAVIGLGDLTAHEVTTEKVARRLDVAGVTERGTATDDARRARVAA